METRHPACGWGGEVGSTKDVFVERQGNGIHARAERNGMRGHFKVRSTLLLTVGILGSACSESSLSSGGGLTLSISAVTPVAVSDSLVLEYDVVGRSLLGLVIDFGDTQVDSVAFGGSQSAGGRVRHLYDTPGQYDITARAEDATQPSTTEQLTVTINP